MQNPRKTQSAEGRRATPGEPRSGLRLEVFGGPILWRGRNRVRISPYQSTLLGVALSWRRDRIPRTSLHRILWDSYGGKSIRHRLSQLIYQVNRSCAAKVLTLEKQHLRVDLERIPTDLERLDELLSARMFKTAYEMIDRGFLSALATRRTPALQDWLRERRQDHRDQLRGICLAVWEEAEMAHDWLTARVTSDVLLRLNPTGEKYLQRVMRASAMSGRVREAEATYLAFAERASSSGNWTPAPETAQLFENVQKTRPLPRAALGVHADPGLRAPLVDRTTDLSLLSRSVYRGDAQRRWTTIAVVGDEGIGKTRLVHEVMEGAQLRGYQVLMAGGAELESSIPLNLLLEVLGQSWARPVLRELPESTKSVLASFLPHVQDDATRRPTMPGPTPDHPSRQACEAFLDVFTEVARSSKTILVLDDFQWVDDATLTVLQFIARRWKTGDFTLLLVYRPEEPGGSGIARRWPDVRAFDRSASVVGVSRLDDDSARRLVKSVATGDLPDAEIDRIVMLGGGNPRFVIDLAVAAPIEMPRHGHRGQVSVPPSVYQAIERRMSGLTDTSKRLASCLAVVGVPATVPELVRLAEVTRDECAAALEELHAIGLLEWSEAAVALRQEIVGVALYERLSPARRSLLHARVAEMLHDSPIPGSADQIALHHFWAGNHDMAHLYATEAVRLAHPSDVTARLRFLRLARDSSHGARRNLAGLGIARLHHLCRRLEAALRRAEETLRDPTGLTTTEIAELQLIAADTRHRLGHVESDATIREFAAIAEGAPGRRGERVRAAVLDATVQLLDADGDRDAVLNQLDRIGKLQPMKDPAARSRVFAALSAIASYGDPDAGVRLARQGVESARETELPDAIALAQQRLAIALMIAGRLGTEDGWNALKEARAACSGSSDRGSLALVLLHLADWQTTTGDHDAAEGTLAEAGGLIRKMDWHEIRAMEAIARGNLKLAGGDLDATAAAVRQAAVILGGSPEGGETTLPHVGNRTLSALDALDGDMLLESGKLAQATKIGERTTLPDSLQEVPLRMILFHARLLSRTGDVRAALDLLARGIAANEPIRPMVWLTLALESVRLARRSGSPQPELAARAQKAAIDLGLVHLAHEFMAFCPR